MFTARQAARRGIAPIEFLMVLPTLTLLFVMLITVAAGGVLCYRLTVEAREQAWADRDATSAGDPQSGYPQAAASPGLAQVFFPNQNRAAQTQPRWRRAEARRGLEGAGVPLVTDRLPEGVRRHAIGSGAWDHRVLPFTQRSGGGDRLALDERVLAFDPGMRLRDFQAIAPND